MASSGKQKTTWSKIQRESKLRERREDKKVRKAARKYAQEMGVTEAGHDEVTEDGLALGDEQSSDSDATEASEV